MYVDKNPVAKLKTSHDPLSKKHFTMQSDSNSKTKTE